MVLGTSPFGGRRHPTFAANQALRLRHSRYVVHAGLARQDAVRVLEPIRVGMRVRSRGRVIDKYVRRGKQYMVTEYVTETRRARRSSRAVHQMLIPP